MESRIAGVETSITELTGKLNAFSGRIEELFGKIESNDVSLKKEVADKTAEIEGTISNIQGVVTARNQETSAISQALATKSAEITALTTAMTAANQEHMDMQADYTKLRDERVVPMENAVLKGAQENETFKANIGVAMDGMTTEIKRIQMVMEHMKSTGITTS